jgi:hypothetical protein
MQTVAGACGKPFEHPLARHPAQQLPSEAVDDASCPCVRMRGFVCWCVGVAFMCFSPCIFPVPTCYSSKYEICAGNSTTAQQQQQHREFKPQAPRWGRRWSLTYAQELPARTMSRPSRGTQAQLAAWQALAAQQSLLPLPPSTPIAKQEPSEAYCLRLVEARVRLSPQVMVVVTPPSEGAMRARS